LKKILLQNVEKTGKGGRNEERRNSFSPEMKNIHGFRGVAPNRYGKKFCTIGKGIAKKERKVWESDLSHGWEGEVQEKSKN